MSVSISVRGFAPPDTIKVKEKGHFFIFFLPAINTETRKGSVNPLIDNFDSENGTRVLYS